MTEDKEKWFMDYVDYKDKIIDKLEDEVRRLKNINNGFNDNPVSTKRRRIAVEIPSFLKVIPGGKKMRRPNMPEPDFSR